MNVNDSFPILSAVCIRVLFGANCAVAPIRGIHKRTTQKGAADDVSEKIAATFRETRCFFRRFYSRPRVAFAYLSARITYPIGMNTTSDRNGDKLN